MTAAEHRVAPGRLVRMHLAIHLEDGTEVLSSLDGDPLSLRIGDGTLAPGLEALLLDLPAGAVADLCADGTALYGEPDAGLIHAIAKEDLPVGFAAEPGQVIAFEAPGGQETAGTVLESRPQDVVIDFNPPLARRRLRVRAQILAVG
jgi:FKBP-type peptidyl-prolyl cis-trans isomerase SlpA